MKYEMLNMCCIEHVLKILDNQMSEIKFVTLCWFAVAYTQASIRIRTN